jgi:NAD+ synthase
MLKSVSIEKLARQLISWIKKTVSAAGGRGVVFGMSGGIDSSVVAALCKRAFPDTCLGIIMPCYSDDMDRKHAELIADQFKIPTKVVALDEIFDSMVNILPVDGYDKTTKKIAESNIKPRLRMLTLYYFANRLNYLVVGSGNRCELFVGYFSKYGDGGVDLMPLGNLVKGQVCKLAGYLDVPREIIDKPPSAGLWSGQTDEEEMGLTYRELDRYLLTGKAKVGVKQRIESLAIKSNHKKCLPSIPPF